MSYKSQNAIADMLVNWLGDNATPGAEITVEALAGHLQIDGPECLAAARRLEKKGMLKVIVGRRGAITRVKLPRPFSHGPLTAPELPIEKLNENLTLNDRFLTISEAKRRLAQSLGVPESAIEITIKA